VHHNRIDFSIKRPESSSPVDRKAGSSYYILYSPAGRAADIKGYKRTLLTDGKIDLRPPLRRDAACIYRAVCESLAEISPWLPFAHEGYCLKESKDFIRHCPEGWKRDEEYVFAVLDAGDGECIGVGGLNRIDHDNRRANLGYWIRTSRTGAGIATAVTRLLAGWGFAELKLNRIEMVIATGNERSRRVAEKAGARYEGTLRNRIKVGQDLYDAAMYSLLPTDLKAAAHG
jgi:RimJ/RimL family protein N-acetyltransferase